MSDNGHLRRSVVTLILMGAMAPWIISASQKTIATMFNAPPLWVPAHLKYRRTYDWFTRSFKCQDTILVSFAGCTIDDDRLPAFCRALLSPAKSGEAARNERLFQAATSGPELLEALRGGDLNLSRRVALNRLRGSFVGPDLTSCAAVVLTNAGGLARKQSLQIIRETAQEVFRIDDDQLMMAGAPVDGAAIDRASIESIQRFSIPSAVIALLLCWLCLRSWVLTLLILLAATFGEGFVLALQTMTGEPMNAIMIVLPVLVFVLTVSAGVHLANYYREALKSGGPATRRALRDGWLPCVLAAATTIIGLASLRVSDMSPIRSFSWLASAGVVVTVALLFLLLPGGMDLTSRFNWSRGVDSATLRPHSWWIDVMTRCVVRYRAAVAIVFAVLVAFLAGGMFSLKTSVNVRSLFDDDSRVLRNYAWLEEHLGPLVPLEVIVQFRPSCELGTLERMELVRDVHIAVARIEEVDGTLSAATFFPNIPPPAGVRQSVRRSTLRSQLGQEFSSFQAAGYVIDEDGQQSWRINTRVSALADLDYGHFLDQLRSQVEPVLNQPKVAGVTALYTGSLPVAYQAQSALLNDLFRSYLTAFSIVALIMMLVLRSVGAGFIAMLPNLFPTLLMFGTMAWLDIAVDIGSVMTASVALGIAVDDTLHFILWFRRETRDGKSSAEAVRSCYQHCGRAMIQTSLICGLGLYVYSLSSFVPTQRFAIMMLGLLFAALAGDLVLLPAILVGRCGRLFRSAPTRIGDEEDVLVPEVGRQW